MAALPRINEDLPLVINAWLDDKTIALFAAVVHHGMSNSSPRSVPAKAETVLDTARKFQHYLSD